MIIIGKKIQRNNYKFQKKTFFFLQQKHNDFSEKDSKKLIVLFKLFPCLQKKLN